MDDKDRKTEITIFKTPSLEILGVAFLILLCAKVFGYSPELSWWVVTSPLWGPWALVILFFLGYFAFMLLVLAILGVFAVASGMYLGITMAVEWIRKKFSKTQKKKKDNDYELRD